MPDLLTAERRLPFDALAIFVGAVMPAAPSTHGSVYLSPIRAVAVVCEVSERTVRDWHRNGLRPIVAERVAHRLGAHPVDVWGLDYYQVEGVA